jgi:signal transduction histidine kinase
MDFSNPSQQEKQKMDINRCVNDAVNLSQVTLRKSGISLELKLEETLPDCYINRLSIEQVILNLITNATEELKESQGKRQVEIRTYQIVNGNGAHYIAITVSDTGQGVPRKLRDRIFDPFFTTKHHGSGIGLSICQRIITDHRGVLYVEENRWSGAKFVVEIPVANEVER